MDALEVETSIAEGEPALPALLQFARASAGTLEAPEAEKGICKRLLPMGLAAMQRSCAQRGTGDIGPAITRADGVLLPRENKLRGRDYGALFGKVAVARTCARTPGEPGICPRDAQVNLPERCSSYCLQAWMTVFAAAHPVTERASGLAQLFDLEGAESVLMAVAQEASEDYDGFDAPRPVAPEASEGAFLGVSVDGQGVPMIKDEAVKLNAQLGPGEKRQRKPAALVGVSSTVDAQPRAPEARAELLVAPEAARARQQRAGTTDEAPRAQQVRRVASLVRTKPAVMACIKADAERRAPQPRTPVVILRDGALGLGRLAPQRFKPWKRVTCGLDMMHVASDLWSAAHALFGEASQAGQHWVQQPLTAMRRGRVGDVSGGLRQLLTKQRRRQSVRQTLAHVLTFLHHHRRWRPYDEYLARGLPVGTGVVELSQLSYPYTDHFL